MSTNTKAAVTVSSRTHEAPNDPFHLVFIICLVLGCGTLLSYNVLVSCATYFNHQFYNYPNIMFIIVPVYSIPNVFFIVLMIPFGDRFSFTIKILGCFIVVGILVLFIPLLVSSNNNIFDLTQNGAFDIFLFIVAAIGSASAILQCSITAFCGLLPTRYLQTLLGGQAVSGILVCIIRIFSKLFLPLSPEGIDKSGLIYFMISAAISIICAISFYWSKHSAFVQHHVNDNIEIKYIRKLRRSVLIKSPPSNDDDDDKYDIDDTDESSVDKTQHIQPITMAALVRQDTPHLLARFVSYDLCDDMIRDSPSQSISFVDDDDILTPLHGTPSMMSMDNMKSYSSTYGSIMVRKNENKNNSLNFQSKKEVISLKDEEENIKMREKRDRVSRIQRYIIKHHKFNYIKYIEAFGNIRYLVLSIWLSMFVTFLWFPGIVTNIKSSVNIINNNGEWMAIIMITEFNICDYIGRQFLSNYTPKWLKEENLWTCSLLRIVTYPLFIAFYNGYIVNDYILHIIMIISALSNGWIASLSFMWFPRNIYKHQQQIAASIMTLGLIIGILSGSCIALIIQPYIKLI